MNGSKPKIRRSKCHRDKHSRIQLTAYRDRIAPTRRGPRASNKVLAIVYAPTAESKSVGSFPDAFPGLRRRRDQRPIAAAPTNQLPGPHPQESHVLKKAQAGRIRTILQQDHIRPSCFSNVLTAALIHCSVFQLLSFRLVHPLFEGLIGFQ